MRAEDLVFWLDVFTDDGDVGGVLCRRHADSMVVPRGWTLDDLRDPELHLFRPPPASTTTSGRRARARRSLGPDETGEQLRLPAEVLDAIGDDLDDAEPNDGSRGTPGADPDELPWTPSFDEADDLDGLLSARGPLLSRAFRTAGRPEH